MAENEDGQERTEQPSEKRLREAREKGNVPRSRELATVAVFGAGVAGLLALGPALSQGAMGWMHAALSPDPELIASPERLFAHAGHLLLRLLVVMLPLIVICLLACVLAPAVMGSQGCIRGGELILADGRRLALRDEFERKISAAEREQLFPLGLRDPYAIQQLDWLRAIERGGDPETSGREGLRDLACAFAILESSALGRQVRVEEVLDGSANAYQREIDQHYNLG